MKDKFSCTNPILFWFGVDKEYQLFQIIMVTMIIFENIVGHIKLVGYISKRSYPILISFVYPYMGDMCYL